MPSIFSGLDAISSSNGSSLDHEELNKLKTEVNEKLSIKQSTANSGKILKVGNDGNIEFVDGGSDSLWKGTKEEWEALSSTEKGKYEIVCFTND